MTKQIIVFVISILTVSVLYAQQPKDTLKTEVIDVVKSYEPTISDSFKLTETPSETLPVADKEEITYQINSVPVASTFTPAKGKPKAVTRPVTERTYENYIALGFGNYTTPYADIFLKFTPMNDTEAGLKFQHHSSQGGIKDLVLSDKYSKTTVGGYYKQETQYFNYQVGADVLHGSYNYYGVPSSTDFNDLLVSNLDAKHSFLNIGLNGKLEYQESLFSGGDAELYLLNDNFDSQEKRISIKPKFEIPVATELIEVELLADYLNGSMSREYSNPDADISYSYLNTGLLPSFKVSRDDFSLNLGVKLYYLFTIGGSENQFKAYPNVDVSYALSGEVLKVFAGANGGLHLNSYREILVENPYVSPDFNSVPTDTKYKFYGGIKGKISNQFDYIAEASYSAVDNLQMFRLNPNMADETTTEELPYRLGNSFSTLYDNAKIVGFKGGISFDLTKELKLGGDVNYHIHTMKNEEEAWNIPSFEMNVFGQYRYNKWLGMAKLFVVGERKDREAVSTSVYNVVSVGSYMDLNAELQYQFTNQLSVFAKTHNLFTSNYNRYYHYPVQGLQIVAGITYKFDM